MKKKTLKTTRLIALIMILVLTLSAVSFTNVFAADTQEQIDWTVQLDTAKGKGYTSDKIYININGTEGSTGWINLGKAVGTGIFFYNVTATVNFKAPDVGEVLSVDTKVSGTDGWYPSGIHLWYSESENHVYIPGGKWVDNGEVVNFKPNRGVSMTVWTANVKNAGTDRNVYATLVDENGLRSAKTNLSQFFDGNAFERSSGVSVVIDTPENFGALAYIDFELSGGSAVASGWKLASVTVKSYVTDKQFVTGADDTNWRTVEVNRWGDKGSPIRVYF